MLQFARLPCWVWVISLNEKRRRGCGYSLFSAASSNTSPKLFNARSIALCAEKILPHLDPSGFLLFTNVTHFCVSDVCLRARRPGINLSAWCHVCMRIRQQKQSPRCERWCSSPLSATSDSTVCSFQDFNSLYPSSLPQNSKSAQLL